MTSLSRWERIQVMRQAPVFMGRSFRLRNSRPVRSNVVLVEGAKYAPQYRVGPKIVDREVSRAPEEPRAYAPQYREGPKRQVEGSRSFMPKKRRSR